MKVVIENPNKIDFTSKGIAIPAFGKITIDESKWKEVLSSNKYVVRAINKRVLNVSTPKKRGK